MPSAEKYREIFEFFFTFSVINRPHYLNQQNHIIAQFKSLFRIFRRAVNSCSLLSTSKIAILALLCIGIPGGASRCSTYDISPIKAIKLKNGGGHAAA